MVHNTSFMILEDLKNCKTAYIFKLYIESFLKYREFIDEQ